MELQKLGCTPGPKPLHKSTIIRNATRLASDDGHPIYAARGKPRKKLSADTIKKRLQFCTSNLNINWDNVCLVVDSESIAEQLLSPVFSDRNKFLFNYPGSIVH